ncbi:MAG: DUF1192 domain-containing protein [Magnetovibrio sp.]|nr:DUF1192 domain-containing protein [Magnetovibrio sp.]|tara:strand:- start:121 stop:303 length:183 start_codon:yes stop_codon:yes gene_type:complete
MDWDELEKPKEEVKPKNLEDLSIEALGDYIDELKSEIERVREAIKEKELARNKAGSFFKS